MRLTSTLLLLFLGLTAARADIAPTTFTGGTIVPIEVDDMHFEDALVRITWGAPCKLEGTFQIASYREEPTTLEIGFPVGRYDQAYSNFDYSAQKYVVREEDCREAVPASVFALEVNGAPLPAFRRVSIPGQCVVRGGQAAWYFANVTLKRGMNTIHLTTQLTPSGVYYQPYQRRIDYCVWTGGRWAGKIVHERIEVVFPDAISPSLIQEMKPSCDPAESLNGLIWDYENIEPRNDFYDISLVVQIPEVDAIVSRMRREHHADPLNTAAALKLAQHLFLLGNAKGNSGFPPGEFLAVDYFVLWAQLSDAEKTVLNHHYSLRQGDRRVASSSEWTDERNKVLKLLADHGWCANYGGVDNVLEAKAVLEDILKREPANEAAWTMLLNNYWRFSFAARGHWFGKTVLGTKPAGAIREAFKRCPNSAAIRAWHDLLASPRADAGKAPVDNAVFSSKGTELDGILKKYETTDAEGWR
jgi:hypothetical protein